MKVLHLTLEKKWFDMIVSGEKTEEYREIKPYWTTRLIGKSYDVIRFKNGYAKESPVVVVKLERIVTGFGIPALGAPINGLVYVLKLGRILESQP